jgi:hypothetical protein
MASVAQVCGRLIEARQATRLRDQDTVGACDLSGRVLGRVDPASQYLGERL